jgi:hypothetical protein
VIRHIQRLLDLGIVRKTVLWIRGNYCEINTYAFVIAWDKSRPQGGSDKTSSTLPHQEREKNSSLRQEWDNQQKTLRVLTPGSGLWERTREEIARLEALLGRKPATVAEVGA